MKVAAQKRVFLLLCAAHVRPQRRAYLHACILKILRRSLRGDAVDPAVSRWLAAVWWQRGQAKRAQLLWRCAQRSLP